MVLLDGEFSQLIDGSTRFMRQLRHLCLELDAWFEIHNGPTSVALHLYAFVPSRFGPINRRPFMLSLALRDKRGRAMGNIHQSATYFGLVCPTPQEFCKDVG